MGHCELYNREMMALLMSWPSNYVRRHWLHRQQTTKALPRAPGAGDVAPGCYA